jgi:NAD(P)-dependent dehydrogenase (short-subunit alcohol dehydrogenase family)
MPGLVEGKAGLVTGSAGGIGRATALALAREGAAGVLVTDLSRRADGEETVRLIEQEGGHAVFVAGDVSVAADCEALVRATVEAFGHLDFAHNNAGVELQDTIVGTVEDDWERVIAVNLKGVWLGMKYQIPQMLEHGGGSIVNTASLAGLMAVPSLAV